MPTPVRPDAYARAAGHEPQDFVDAVQRGESEYAGVPIGSWRQEGGEYLAVPDSHADHLGLSPSDGRSNPSTAGQRIGQMATVNGEDVPVAASKSAGVAAAEAAPPVSANAGAAYAAGQFAETVKEQPQVMEDFADTAALLGSAGLAYATAEEGDVMKAGATAAGMFAIWKLLRHSTAQEDRRTDMKERQQRAQIQQNRQRQLPNGQQRQLGRRRRNGR